jgi:hypothetical protein
MQKQSNLPVRDKIQINKEIQTPNGAGIVGGSMIEDEVTFILVRHAVSKMTGKAGRCITPKAKLNTLYAYSLAELDPLN